MRTAKRQYAHILNKQGEVLTENAQEQARWKEYVEELYDQNCKPRANDIPTELEGDTDKQRRDLLVHLEKFEKAFSKLQSGKAQGIDGIPAELLKTLGSRGKQELYEIRNDIHISGE